MGIPVNSTTTDLNDLIVSQNRSYRCHSHQGFACRRPSRGVLSTVAYNNIGPLIWGGLSSSWYVERTGFLTWDTSDRECIEFPCLWYFFFFRARLFGALKLNVAICLYHEMNSIFPAETNSNIQLYRSLLTTIVILSRFTSIDFYRLLYAKRARSQFTLDSLIHTHHCLKLPTKKCVP